MTDPGLAVMQARQRLIQAALACLSADYADESADAGAQAEYADDQLAHAARDHTRAVSALSRDKQPVGWGE